jgi:hypothetical protein
MVTLIFCLAIGMVLAATLKLIGGRYSMTVRSMDWNQTIPVLEAGIEEAMTHLHDDASITANGWTAITLNGQPVYAKQRTFSDGSYFYTTIYSNSSVSPLIFSQGYVRSPLKANKYISRMVWVTLTNPPNVFTHAIATGSDGIAFNGSNPFVDSYDSAIGPYNTTSNHSSMGNIATDSTNHPAISLGGGTVYGSVTTGPGGTISGGTITGTTNNNMNVAYPSNSPPANVSSFLPLANSPLPGTNVVVVPSGSYSTSSFNSAGPMLITGNVTIYDSGGFNISGQDYIQIMPGASLTLYIGGNASLSGGGVLNGTGFAANFSILGLCGCTSISYSGSGQFNGTVYAPSADAAIKGNGLIYGAIIAKGCTLGGNAQLIYDTELAKIGGLVAVNWVER